MVDAAVRCAEWYGLGTCVCSPIIQMKCAESDRWHFDFSFISMKSYFLYTQFFSRGAGQGIVIDATCVCDDHSFIHYRFNTTTVCAPKYTNGQIECNSINCSSNSIMLYSLIQLCSTSNSTTFGTLTAYLASVHHQRAHTHKTRSLQTMPLCMIL